MQAKICIRRLFLDIASPFIKLEVIINKPRKADPEKAIHNNLRRPLKGV